MITYLLLSKDDTSCYALDITWENGETFCRMAGNIAIGMTAAEVGANNLMMNERVDGGLCPISVVVNYIYFGGHAYFIQNGTIYQDDKCFKVPWFKLADIVNDWMRKRPFTITPCGERFRLSVAGSEEVKAAKKVCINGSFYETIDFDLSDSLPCYDKPMTFPIPENDGRFVPYCHNRTELLRVLNNINRYEDVDKQDYQQLENGNWTITDRALSRLFERVIGSPEVKTVRDIKKIIKFLDNI